MNSTNLTFPTVFSTDALVIHPTNEAWPLYLKFTHDYESRKMSNDIDIPYGDWHPSQLLSGTNTRAGIAGHKLMDALMQYAPSPLTNGNPANVVSGFLKELKFHTVNSTNYHFAVMYAITQWKFNKNMLFHWNGKTYLVNVDKSVINKFLEKCFCKIQCATEGIKHYQMAMLPVNTVRKERLRNHTAAKKSECLRTKMNIAELKQALREIKQSRENTRHQKFQAKCETFDVIQSIKQAHKETIKQMCKNYHIQNVEINKKYNNIVRCIYYHNTQKEKYEQIIQTVYICRYKMTVEKLPRK